MPKRKLQVGDRVKFVTNEEPWDKLGTGVILKELFDGLSFQVKWTGEVPKEEPNPCVMLASNLRKVSLYLDLKEAQKIAAGFKEAVTEMRLRAMVYAEDPSKTNRESFDRMYTATVVCADNLESILKEMER